MSPARKVAAGGGASRIPAVTARELRAYFNSPIAYVFLSVFAGAALFTFFNVEAFFARGVADLRGLFAPLPLLMILLVPALTMRLWAEDRGADRLDWGPVVGGYLGAVLLGGAYLAAGQFLSASTENQILAFILALVVCLALYGLGTEAFAGLFSDRLAGVLRALGTGSRFQSIARGVIDLRDLVYYASLTLFFLAACVLAVRARRWT